MAYNTTVLAQRIEKAIDAEITRRLGAISNSVLRAAVHELLKDSVSEKILDAVNANPPKAIDITVAVRQSMDEVAQNIASLKGTVLKSKFKSVSSSTSNDNGGKSSSGGKTSTRSAPTRSYSSGGKGGGYGGK